MGQAERTRARSEWARTFNEPAFCTEQCPYVNAGGTFLCPTKQGRDTAKAVGDFIDGKTAYSYGEGLSELASRTYPVLGELAAACAVRVGQYNGQPIQLRHEPSGEVWPFKPPFTVGNTGIIRLTS